MVAVASPRFGTASSCLVANCTTTCFWWTPLTSTTAFDAGLTAWSWRWWLGCVTGACRMPTPEDLNRPDGKKQMQQKMQRRAPNWCCPWLSLVPKFMPWLKTILSLLTILTRSLELNRKSRWQHDQKNMTGISITNAIQCPCRYAGKE